MSPEEGVKDDNTEIPGAAHAKGAIVFQDKIEIYIDKPLPMYNAGSNLAYRAAMRDKSGAALIAIICSRSLAPRNSAVEMYRKFINPNLLQLVDFGKVFWPPSGQERQSFFYLSNIGAPLLAVGDDQALSMRPEDVIASILRPVVNALMDFRDKDFVHGNIRLSNMFDNGIQGKGMQVVLGDCLSTPASYLQPALYETISRGMADPIARAKGLLSDDLYSVGVSLAVALRQHDPLQITKASEIVKHKIMHGSFATLVGKERFKPEILDLLRGLLQDDVSQRWTLDDVLQWLEGQRITVRHATNLKKPARPFSFGAEKFMSLQLLAIAASSNANECKKIIEDDSLNQWIDRSVQDDELSERFVKAQSKIRQSGLGHGYEDRIASYVSTALDPKAPLRYKGLSVLGDGIGCALLEAIETKKSLNSYAEIISSGLLSSWLEEQSTSTYDISSLFNKFELSKRFLRNNKMGEGLERCLYLLAPDAHCMSEVLKEFYITTPDDILRAFERLCKKQESSRVFIDRHIAAFIYQKDLKLIEACMFDLNTGEPHRVLLATLRCFANIQKRYNVEKVPALSKTLVSMIPILLKRLHDRSAREKIEKNIQSLAEGGDLQKLLAVLDNKEFLSQDLSLFRAAMREYAMLESERQRLEKELVDKDRFGFEIGKEWAAIISCVLAAVIILFTTLSHFAKTGMG